ncbi:MAG: isocitrate lyase/PEP mutase family protein [Erythrobacter sp.]
MNQAKQLRAKITAGEFVAAPGTFDGMSMLIANQHNFAAHYASGYWTAASRLGLPDVGIASYTDFITCFAMLAKLSKAPLIADADSGFGSVVNLMHAVRGYQDAGIAAMQIEDQPFPRFCGHSGHTEVVSTEEMASRIGAANEARGDGDMMIIARSDSRRSEGLDSALERLAHYGECGADILFLEAPLDNGEIELAGQKLSKPLMINAAHGGFSPILDPGEYAKLGVSITIYPGAAPLTAMQAVDTFYSGLAQGSAQLSDAQLYDFPSMSKMLGMDAAIAAVQSHQRGTKD